MIKYIKLYLYKSNSIQISELTSVLFVINFWLFKTSILRKRFLLYPP